ncbi:MAG: SDR family NAD(P)-dependent oxidoreductase [Actinobacteria bacterium]|nr:SDR family NAD(P)-dependent oxidoreductase [Actinomycetota bacterium]
MLQGLEGKVALVTGAGQGLGRSHALELARQGVRVVVNDLGRSLGGDVESSAADAVVEEIRALGGEAVADYGDVADWDSARAMVRRGIDEWGRFDILVNNAGFLRDRMLFNLSEDEFDSVVRVHLKGHFATMRHAAEHWRTESKAADGPVYARIISTASEAMLFGSPGQPGYASAKAAVVQLTLVAANSLARLGVRANAIAPRARTRMTVDQPSIASSEIVDGFDPYGPEHVSPLVAYLASPAADHVSGQLFIVVGRTISVVHGPFVEQKFEIADGWTPDSVDAVLTPFYADRRVIQDGFTLADTPRS